MAIIWSYVNGETYPKRIFQWKMNAKFVLGMRFKLRAKEIN